MTSQVKWATITNTKKHTWPDNAHSIPYLHEKPLEYNLQFHVYLGQMWNVQCQTYIWTTTSFYCLKWQQTGTVDNSFVFNNMAILKLSSSIRRQTWKEKKGLSNMTSTWLLLYVHKCEPYTSLLHLMVVEKDILLEPHPHYGFGRMIFIFPQSYFCCIQLGLPFLASKCPLFIVHIT